MEVSAASHGLEFTNCILQSNSILCGSSSELSYATGVLSVSAVTAPPAVRSYTYRIIPRTFTRHQRRTRRKRSTGDPEDGEEDGFFGDGDDGPFGGGRSGGSGGRGWNFDGYGGFGSEEFSYSSSFHHALDFFYEVICWIAFSNCLHFAFKKLVRIVAVAIGDPSRDKVPMRLVSM